MKSGDRHVEQGVGVRAQSGERQGYAHSDDVTVESLEIAATTARAWLARVTKTTTRTHVRGERRCSRRTGATHPFPSCQAARPAVLLLVVHGR